MNFNPGTSVSKLATENGSEVPTPLAADTSIDRSEECEYRLDKTEGNCKKHLEIQFSHNGSSPGSEMGVFLKLAKELSKLQRSIATSAKVLQDAIDKKSQVREVNKRASKSMKPKKYSPFTRHSGRIASRVQKMNDSKKKAKAIVHSIAQNQDNYSESDSDFDDEIFSKIRQNEENFIQMIIGSTAKSIVNVIHALKALCKVLKRNESLAEVISSYQYRKLMLMGPLNRANIKTIIQQFEVKKEIIESLPVMQGKGNETPPSSSKENQHEHDRDSFDEFFPIVGEKEPEFFRILIEKTAIYIQHAICELNSIYRVMIRNEEIVLPVVKNKHEYREITHTGQLCKENLQKIIKDFESTRKAILNVRIRSG